MKQATWLGPHRVVLQDGNHTIWTTVSGKLFRSAPEHVRPALPGEGEPATPWLPEEITAGQRQISRMQRPEEEIPHRDNHNSSGSNGPNDDNPPQPEPATESQDPPITPNHPSQVTRIPLHSQTKNQVTLMRTPHLGMQKLSSTAQQTMR